MSDDPADAPTDPGSPTDTAWRGLHPASVLVNLLPRTWRFARSAWPLLLAFVVGSPARYGGLFDLALLLVFFGGTVGSTIVHWATLRYRVHDGRLEIGSGLLTRQVRVIDPTRIQNIELVRNVFHRASGLVEVRIETASGTEVEGLLSALSETDGTALMSALASARAAAPSDEEHGEELAHNDLSDLLRYGATAARFGAGMVVAIGVVMQGLQWLQPDEVDQVGRLSGWSLAMAFVAVLTGTWLVGTVTAVVRFFGFRLALVGDRLVATAGLFTTRRIELQLKKVQLVSVREPLLRRMAGFGSLLVETAAARDGAGGTVSAEAVIPVVDRADMATLMGRALPGATAALWDGPLQPPHPNALKRRLLAAVVRSVVIGGLLSWFLFPWGILLAVALAVGSIVTAWLDHHAQGWRLHEGLLLARQGYLDRQTAILPIAKLQSVDVVQGIFRRRWGIARVVVKVAGTGVALPDLGIEAAYELQQELIRSLGASGAPAPQG